MTLQLSQAKRLCLKPTFQTSKSSTRVHEEVERESKVFAFPLCQILPTFSVLLLWQEKCFKVLVSCKYVRQGFFLPASRLKQVCCTGGLSSFKEYQEESLTQQAPEEHFCTYQKCTLQRNSCTVHLAEENPR